MVAERLQIRYKPTDYELYKNWTGDSRAKKLGFMIALFKRRNDTHFQGVFAGEFSQGKTSSAIEVAKHEQKFTRRLMKMEDPQNYEKLKADLSFTVEHSIIISPRDPASRAIHSPKAWKSYIGDEGYLFGTTAQSGTHKVAKMRDDIAQNRKLHPSFYWIYPNIFKMPSMILELMDCVIQKEDVRTGDVIMPSRVIQLKEKFDQDRIARYARYPKLFKKLIRYHPSFLAKVRFHKQQGKGWGLYLEKYDKYKMTDEAGTDKVTNKERFFAQIEKLIENRTITSSSKKDIGNLIFNLVKKKAKMTEEGAEVMASSLTDDFMNWREEKVATSLAKALNESAIAGIQNDLKIEEGS